MDAIPIITLAFLLALSRKRALSWDPSTKRAKGTKRWLLGIDVGGTSVKFAWVDGWALKGGEEEEERYSPGALVKTLSAPLVSKTPTPEALVAQIREVVRASFPEGREAASSSKLRGIGVCIPGRVENNTVSTVSNLGWTNNHDRPIPLGRMISEALRCDRVLLENDAKTALVGEMWVASSSSREIDDRNKKMKRNKSDNVVMITFGTGIGGAVAVEGKILRGATGMLGEFGHSIIQCYLNASNAGSVTYRKSTATGVEGIVEDYCSSRGMRETWERFFSSSLTLGGRSTSIPFPGVEEVLRRAEKAGGMESRRMSVEEEENAREEEEVQTRRCVTVANFTLACVGALVVNVARYYDPSLVILAGGFVENGEWFRRRVEMETDARFWSIGPRQFDIVRCYCIAIVTTETDDDAQVLSRNKSWSGAVGAAALALRGEAYFTSSASDLE